MLLIMIILQKNHYTYNNFVLNYVYLNSCEGVNLTAPIGNSAHSNSIAFTIYANLSTSKKFLGGGFTSTSESSSFFITGTYSSGFY